MRVTIFDIAEQLNISASTVSRALNDSPLVNEKTKEEIRRVANKLNYNPNVIARRLRTGKSDVIGVVTDSISDMAMLSAPFKSHTMKAIEETARKKGFNIVICDLEMNFEKEAQYSNFFKSYQAAGIIIYQCRLRQTSYKKLQKLGLPMVYIHCYPAEKNGHVVLPNNVQGGFIAAQHLLKLGKKRIAFLRGDDSYQSSHDRFKGYCMALGEAGIKLTKNYIRGGLSWEQETGYTEVTALCRLKNPPEGIFCASDMLAAGALKAASAQGLKVPDDIAIVGFDNRAFCPYLNPPLTSVALPVGQMGETATELLVEDIINGSSKPERLELDCSLVIRKSCGG
jgi:DNA-binding LacI/PurR family transcriptional regulator